MISPIHTVKTIYLATGIFLAIGLNVDHFVLAQSQHTVGDTAANVFLTENSKAVFTSRAPMLTFSGESDQLNGMIDLEQNLLDFYLDLETLETGIRLRDKHMRDSYLETDSYPFAEFRGHLAQVPSFEDSDTASVVAVGRFKVHGIEREIEVPGVLIRRSEGLLLSAEWTIDLPDYEISVPKVVFYELSETQMIRIEGLFRPYESTTSSP